MTLYLDLVLNLISLFLGEWPARARRIVSLLACRVWTLFRAGKVDGIVDFTVDNTKWW